MERCQILLGLDEDQGTGLTHAQLAHSYAVCPATITNIAQPYVKNGIKDIIRYNISPNSSAALRKVDGRAGAHTIRMACSPAPGGHSRWTPRLLEEKARIGLNWEGSHPPDIKKNGLRPHKNAYWCIPPKGNAESVACMEDILDIYEKPYGPAVPVVCMDGKPYQLLGEAHGQHICIRGALGGVRHVSVREHRTAVGWAEGIRYLVDVSYPGRDRAILVMDSLDTHALPSLYKAFPAPEARRTAKKLETHYTPKHGSRLDIAEIGLNVMTRQCLSRRIDDIGLLRQELAAWGSGRNEHTACIHWHFTTNKARTKLTSPYPKSDTTNEK